MNTIRSLLFVMWMYGWMAILGILALPTLLLPRGALLWFIRTFARTVVFGLRWICGVRVEIRGREHVPGGPVLIAGKHQAMLDVFVPFLIFRDPVLVMKRELLWYPVIGWYSLKLRLLAIDRDGGAKTMKKMLAAAEARVNGESRQMLIYPEGTRSEPGAAPSYKPAGIRAFYKSLKLPLVPLATNAGLCWPAKGLTRRPGKVVYEVLPAMASDLNPKAMLGELETVLEAACDRLIDEGLAVQGRTRADL
ncbi:MAG: 1-acyl-sn-glycerol-3-phosphate acyltransferase [Henriciella sp.]|nr:1-acyl-sn-glycerol-3-phosphate acyltransferase [Henriciella sp.]